MPESEASEWFEALLRVARFGAVPRFWVSRNRSTGVRGPFFGGPRRVEVGRVLAPGKCCVAVGRAARTRAIEEAAQPAPSSQSSIPSR